MVATGRVRFGMVGFDWVWQSWSGYRRNWSDLFEKLGFKDITQGQLGRVWMVGFEKNSSIMVESG